MAGFVAKTALRHPEKAHKPDKPSPVKPPWIKVRAPKPGIFFDTQRILRNQGLVTVCEEAACPNIAECWSEKHATIMIMGDTCTRGCAFCNVRTGRPAALSKSEPNKVANAVAALQLRHVVITSVDRDDLPDGGATHFAKTVIKVREKSPNTTIETLTPDFLRKEGAFEVLLASKPDVFNHNLETVPRLYPTVRPGARYGHSLGLFANVKKSNPEIFTKSGLMVGLGEEKREVLEVMDDLRSVDVDFLTIGQYLQPTPKHHRIERFLTPEEFEEYKALAFEKNFSMVSASPLTRSSYHADRDFLELRRARQNN